jgi:uncharacterized membrane protein
MLVSHHAPADFDRTIVWFGLRICSRCLGVAAGVAASGLLWSHWPTLLHLNLVAAVCGFLLPVPAAIDFLSHEIGLRRSNNVIRFLTGIPLGIAAMLVVFSIVRGNFGLAILQAAWLGAIEIASAVLLKRTGCLDAYLGRYESGVRILLRDPRHRPVAGSDM